MKINRFETESKVKKRHNKQGIYASLIIGGRWLENLGWSIGEKVRVTASRDKIIIDKEIE